MLSALGSSIRQAQLQLLSVQATLIVNHIICLSGAVYVHRHRRVVADNLLPTPNAPRDIIYVSHQTRQRD